jgi:GDP/UDP-N,N'-diacetylbacillosamine 2-epimerase (hydrolysing)
MKIGILTSSRADYSIYYPLLKQLEKDPFFEFNIIAFGTHLSNKYGYTLDAIKKDGFKIGHCVETLVEGDSAESVSLSMGKTITNFSSVWANDYYDLLFCLGDRYEMFAAVSSTIPYNLRVAHISGGETTLGAIDNVFRHSLSLMSQLHFASTEQYRKRVIELIGQSENVYDVGALSIDNLSKLQLYSTEEFKTHFNIDLSIPTILITFHPETVSFEKNETYIDELIAALSHLQGYQYLITMPNADTMGSMIREKLLEFIERNEQAIGVESLGTIGYLSAMKHCAFMLGNTSSGFVEASYFPKFVINLGERQTGRIITPNIINTPILKNSILNAVTKIKSSSLPEKVAVYGEGDAAVKIVRILKHL